MFMYSLGRYITITLRFQYFNVVELNRVALWCNICLVQYLALKQKMVMPSLLMLELI